MMPRNRTITQTVRIQCLRPAGLRWTQATGLGCLVLTYAVAEVLARPGQDCLLNQCGRARSVLACAPPGKYRGVLAWQ